METEILLIKSVEERKGRSSGNTFWSIATDKGEYTCHEPFIFDELAKNQGNKCKLETLRTEKYNNIKRFVEVVEVGAPVETPTKEKPESKGWAKIEMLVSYAKDLVVAGKEDTMDKAITSVIGAYREVSKEL